MHFPNYIKLSFPRSAQPPSPLGAAAGEYHYSPRGELQNDMYNAALDTLDSSRRRLVYWSR